MAVTPPMPAPPAFVIGVTGRMELDDASAAHRQVIRQEIRRVIDTLAMSPPTDAEITEEASRRKKVAKQRRLKLEEVECESSIPRLGVPYSRMKLLTSMAPGADTIAAEAAHEGTVAECIETSSDDAAKIAVVGVLPFPVEYLSRTTTFIWANPRRGLKGNLADENARRVSSLQKWLDKGLSDSFHVCLSSDDRLDSNELAAKWEMSCVVDPSDLNRSALTVQRGLSDESRRDRRARYRAAGEYVAVQSHVLIAVTTCPANAGQPDDLEATPMARDRPIVMDVFDSTDVSDPIDAGAQAIVQVKQSGITSGLLTDSPAFTWASNGPVIRIQYPNDWLDHSSECVETLRSMLKVTVSYPVDATGDPVSDRQQFETLVANLTRFQNATAHLAVELKTPQLAAQEVTLIDYLCPSDDKPGLHSKGACLPRAAAVTLQKSTHLSVEDQARFLGGVHGMWKLRSAAAKIARAGSARYDQTLFRMFITTLAAAIFLHLGSHWHVEHDTAGVHELDQNENGSAENDSGTSAEVIPAPQPSVARQDGDSPYEQLADLRWLFQFMGLFLVMVALHFFRTHRDSRNETTRFDYRVLAEGLRVQVYWILAGLKESVPASYMHRQRGEMDWFRRAISSITAPYDRWPIWFDGLTSKDKLQALRMVAKRWVHGQYEYCSDEFHKQHSWLHLHHIVGQSFAIAGICFVFIELMALLFPQPLRALCHHPVLYGSVGLSVIIVWSGLWYFGRSAVGRTTKAPDRHGKDPGAHEIKPWPWPWLKDAGKRESQSECDWEAFRWVWTLLEHASVASPLHDGLRYIFTTGGLVLFGVAFALFIPSLHLPLPDADVWFTLFAGGYLLIGGMSIAYAEKKAYSEHSLQYNAMASMYRAAWRRIMGHLEEAERLVTEREALLQTPEPEDPRELAELQQKIRMTEHQTELRIRAVQQLMKQVGEQALDENAEWLILHRARPMEPVMAG